MVIKKYKYKLEVVQVNNSFDNQYFIINCKGFPTVGADNLFDLWDKFSLMIYDKPLKSNTLFKF